MSSGALQLFRSCTTSLSSRALARSSPLARSHPRRYYSNGTAEGAKEDAAADSTDTSGKEAEQLSPEAAKLKAKEGEVVDLMVRAISLITTS